jgi:TPR repeat protein
MRRRPRNAEETYRRGLRLDRRFEMESALACFLRAADMGHADAARRAGEALVHGWGARPNAKRGFALLEEAAARGSGEAYWQLANLHEEGTGPRKDLRRALAYARRGWDATRTAHCATIAGDILDELGRPRSAFEWHLRGAKAGDPDGMTTTGVHYRYGEGVRKDLKEAVRWYRLAARRGCPNANSNLGICFKNGEGVRRDRRKAFEYKARAARLGHARAKIVVAAWTIDGFGVRRDAAKGVAMLRRLARRDPAAAYELGDRYGEGDGVPKDARRAVRWHRSAARRGSMEAVNSLGVAHYHGRGVRKDRRAAVAFYRRAAAAGNGVAWHNLGLCYREGEGVARSAAKARECFAKAREKRLSSQAS